MKRAVLEKSPLPFADASRFPRKRGQRRVGALAFAALLCATPTPTLAQSVQAGDVAFTNSGAPAAQAPFLTGLALLHDFDAPPSWRSSGPRPPIPASPWPIGARR